MRGVVSGAMLIALRDLGLAQYVDVYYGTSSGSINISYFATDAAWEALSVYPDQLPNGFLRGWPRLPHRPVLDMEFLRTVMTERVPLDRDRLATSGRDVRIVLANVVTVQPEIVDIRQHSTQAIDYLMASSWLPLLAGGPFELDGRRYLDGGILWPTLCMPRSPKAALTCWR